MKIGPETVDKYSHQNLFVIICRLYTSTYKSIYKTVTSDLQNQYQR